MNLKDKVRLQSLAGALALMLVLAAAAAGQPVISDSLPDADVGAAYGGQQLVSGGTPPYVWTITGTAPSWLSFNSDGSVSASSLPNAVGTFNFNAQVTDSSTPTALTSTQVALSITVNAALTITPVVLSPGQQGVAYSSTTLTAAGGTGSYTWSLAGGSSPLPPGLSLGANGSISAGPPTTPGTYPFTVQVADGITTATQGFSITINPPPPPPPSITTPTVPQGEATVPYSTTLAEMGGTGPNFTWALASGSLPTGVGLASTGVISGTPTQTGSFPFTVTVTDSASMTSAPQGFTLTVIAGPGITTTSPLPAGEATAPYSQTLTASGGTNSGFTWTVASGSLPGLTLSAAGLISGAPTTVGLSNFTIQVTDSAGGKASEAFTLNVIAGPSITTPSSLPAGELSVPYSQTLAASGGTNTGFSWTVTAGSLPAGLTLSAGGVISGTPTTAGPSNFTVQVTDSGSGKASQAFTLTINAGLSITTASALPQGEVTAPYSQTLAASGGTNTGFSWTVTAGSLPAGLTLSAGGVISGTPTTAGPSNFTVQVTDSGSGKASQAFTLNIITGPGIITTSLPSGPAEVSYSQTLTASGGTGLGFTWSVTHGLLPPGLGLSLNGAISGLPSITGSFPFTVTVTDSVGGSASKALTIIVTAALSITTTSPLPAGEATAPYSQTLTAAGGSGAPFRWSVSGGSSLPPGLSLTANALTGTPTTTGGFTFGLTVTDSGGNSVSGVFLLNITAGPSITTSVLPPGETTVPYSQTLSATGGTNSGFVWTVTGGSLPAGLSLAAGGVIFGTPTATGAFNFTIQVTDSGGGKASQPFSLTLSSGPSITTNATLPQGEAGVPYSQTLAVTGGSGGFVWSLSGGALPAGLSLSGGGVISGTPTAVGTANFTVKVTDSTNGTATLAMSIQILGAPTIITQPTLPNGVVGVVYTSVTLAVSGGISPYTWSIITGSLPAGLTLDGNAGTISGIPSAGGTSGFTIQVIDTKGGKATQQFSITISAGLTITTAPGLATAAINVAYSVTVSAAGGTAPYTWSLAGGALPGGLTLNASTGVIGGVPSTSGNFTFTLKVTDGASSTASKQFTIIVSQPVAITTAATLPSGAAGTPYSAALGASGGTPPYSWAITGGALPSGLNLDASSGVIKGTPVSSGTFNFTVKVTDRNSLFASQQFSLTIVSGLTITTPSLLPQGAANSPYSVTLSATGGTAPYTWTLAVGKLPAGLTLNETTGSISGTPTANGTATFSIQVTDHVNATATQQFALTIGTGLVITSGSTLPSGTLAKAYQPLTLAAVGGTQPYTWSLSSGSIPAGLSLSANGVLSGTPTVAGAFTFTIQVKDSVGATATLTFKISIAPPPLPEVTLGGLPQTSSASQQISFGVTLASAYPLDISGQITLSFQPDATVPATDPGLQFASGATANFAIPANTTTAVFAPSSSAQIGLQTGTISGTITLNFTLTAAGVPLPATGLDQTITIPRSAPVIQSVQMAKNSTGFEIHIKGYSSPRDLAEADLTFTAAAGANLVTTRLTESLTSVATAWYQSAGSAQFGSQFLLVLPFTASQGSVDAVGSVAVVLKNSQGSSPSATGTF